MAEFEWNFNCCDRISSESTYCVVMLYKWKMYILYMIHSGYMHDTQQLVQHVIHDKFRILA